VVAKYTFRMRGCSPEAPSDLQCAGVSKVEEVLPASYEEETETIRIKNMRNAKAEIGRGTMNDMIQ
jgi:hypothetical protein